MLLFPRKEDGLCAKAATGHGGAYGGGHPWEQVVHEASARRAALFFFPSLSAVWPV